VKTVYIVRIKGKHEVRKLDHLYSDWLVSEPAKIVSRTLHTSGLMIFPLHETAVSHVIKDCYLCNFNRNIVHLLVLLNKYVKNARCNNQTDVVIQQHSRKLLMMDILMSETC